MRTLMRRARRRLLLRSRKPDDARGPLPPAGESPEGQTHGPGKLVGIQNPPPESPLHSLAFRVPPWHRERSRTRKKMRKKDSMHAGSQCLPPPSNQPQARGCRRSFRNVCRPEVHRRAPQGYRQRRALRCQKIPRPPASSPTEWQRAFPPEKRRQHRKRWRGI